MACFEMLLGYLCAFALASAAFGAEANGLWDLSPPVEAPLDADIVSSVAKDGYKVDELYITSQVTANGPNRVFVTLARPASSANAAPVFINLTGGPDSPDVVLWLAKRLQCAVADIEWRNLNAKHRSKWACPTDLGVWHIGSGVADNIGYALVSAVRRVIDYLTLQPDIDISRVACGGGSMGGYYSLLAAGVDSRIRYVFDTYGAGNLARSGGRIGAGLRDLTPDQRRMWLEAFDPLNYAPRTSAKTFVYLAANDYFFWLGDGIANYDALAGDKRLLIVPNYNHNLGAFGAPIPDCGWDWVEHCLHGKPAFATVSDPRARGGAYTWKAAGPLPIVRSVLYWSPAKVNWPSRYWLPIPAVPCGDTWTAEIPRQFIALEARVYATVFDQGNRAVSSRIVARRGLDPCTQHGPLWPTDSLWDTQRGAAAWRPPGPANIAGSTPASVEAVGDNGLRVAPDKEQRRFALLTNSVVLAAGRAREYAGIRLVVDGCGHHGKLTISLQRGSGSADEIAYTTTARYRPAKTSIAIPWAAFGGPTGAPKEPYPFDGLRFDGERADGSALVIESIALYGRVGR